MPKLLANEQSIVSTRQNWSVLAPAVVVALIVVVIGVVVLHIAPSTIAGKDTSTVVNGLRIAIILTALVVILVQYLQWRAAQYVLTNRRVVISHGVVSTVTESITLDRIQDVTIRRSLGARLLGAGDLDIESAGRDGIEVLHRISNPQSFYDALMDAMEAHRTRTQAAPGNNVVSESDV